MGSIFSIEISFWKINLPVASSILILLTPASFKGLPFKAVQYTRSFVGFGYMFNTTKLSACAVEFLLVDREFSFCILNAKSACNYHINSCEVWIVTFIEGRFLYKKTLNMSLKEPGSKITCCRTANKFIFSYIAK